MLLNDNLKVIGLGLLQAAAQLEFIALANANMPTLANINSANAS